MESKIDLAALTAEQRAALMAELKEQQVAAEKKKQEDKQVYLELVDETVRRCFEDLTEVSKLLQRAKQNVFEEFATVVKMKEELYAVKDSQATHTFTTSDGRLTLTIGNRQIDDYDATMESGVAKVKEFIASLAKDETSAKLVEIVNSLLRMDKHGNLKPSRVMELGKLAAEIDSDDFKEGVAIIQQSYQPRKSCTFVSACVNFATGKRYLPLSMSTAGVGNDIDSREQ